MKRLIALLRHPLTKDLGIDDARTTLLRQQIVREKRFLAQLYREWNATLGAAIPAGPGRVLELGSGGDVLREFIPDLVTSNILALPQLERRLIVIFTPRHNRAQGVGQAALACRQGGALSGEAVPDNGVRHPLAGVGPVRERHVPTRDAEIRDDEAQLRHHLPRSGEGDLARAQILKHPAITSLAAHITQELQPERLAPHGHQLELGPA